MLIQDIVLCKQHLMIWIVKDQVISKITYERFFYVGFSNDLVMLIGPYLSQF